MSARPRTPPTTPPAIAPTGVEELEFWSSVEPDAWVGVVAEAEGTLRETGVGVADATVIDA